MYIPQRMMSLIFGVALVYEGHSNTALELYGTGGM